MQSSDSFIEKGNTAGEKYPFVSLIIPTFNEEKYIGNILEQMLQQDYPFSKMEILVADGNSKDKTQEIVKKYSGENPQIRLLINEKQYVPFALNLGIKESKGEYILILGAHSSYPKNYISALINASISLDADNVGGLCIGKAPDNQVRSIAIAAALASPFGVGNSLFRIGVNKITKVDTVTFGCYKRSVFDKIGLFDEELLRNQDDELNARLIKHKGSIYLLPDISVTYFTRNSIQSVLKMFYQYGFFKPLVSLKIGKPTTVRQLIPFLFVSFILVSLIAGIWIHKYWYLLGAVMLLHTCMGIYFSIRIVSMQKNPKLILYLPWLFFLLQFSYGWGYIRGILKFIVLGQRIKAVGSSR